MTPENISKKLRTFAHTEYSHESYSAPDVIKTKIKNKKDLFNRGYDYIKVELDNSFPKYLLQNKDFYKDFIE